MEKQILRIDVENLLSFGVMLFAWWVIIKGAAIVYTKIQGGALMTS